jgi:PAS domain S-box-containing protein
VVAGLQASVRSAMRAVRARWGCVASAEGDSFVATLALGQGTARVPGAGTFFSQVRAEGALVVASREGASSFADAHLVDFAPGLLVGVCLGPDDVLVVADAQARVLDDSDAAALEDVAVTARELLAVERRAEALSTQLFDRSPDAMLVVAQDGRIVRANGGIEKLLGYHERELRSMRVEDLVPPSARASHARMRGAYSAAASPRQMGTRARMSALRRDGTEVPVDIMLGAFTTDDVPHVLAVLRDMSAREAALATLRMREEQLRQAQRLELLGQFAASVAHDFNNLLTVVSSCSELMADDPSCPPALRAGVDDVRTAAARGAVLTRQLLAFARNDTPQHRSVCVTAACEGVRSVLQRLVGTSHELVVRIEPELGCVCTDEGHIEQLLMNLVANARDATPAGRSIDVVAKRVEIGAGHEVPEGDYVVLEVSDTGVGISPEILARIFEPRFTTKPADRGSGLGLAIVHRVVTESAGHLRVESEVGRGTKFTVLLPRVSTPPPVPAKRAASLDPHGTRILVVDDERVSSRLIVAILSRAGYQVSDASSAEAALEVVRSSPPELLVTDVSLLGASGPELVATLRAERPGLRAVFVTGNPAGCREEALRCRVVDVPIVEKPFSFESLTAQVAAALAEAGPDHAASHRL